MSVAFVRKANSAAQSGSFTSDTVSFDATGCNFVVGFVANLGASPNMASPTATYAGAAMTLVSGSPFGPSSGASNKVAAFYLANPTTGTNNFVPSWTNAQTRVGSLIIGVSGAAGTISSIQSSTAGGTLSVTSNAGGLVVAAQVDQDGTDRTLTSGTTDSHVTTGSFSFGGGHFAGASSVSVTWTSDGTGITDVAFNIDGGQTLTLTAAAGSYTLTGIAAGLGRSFRLVAATGSYVLTGVAASFQRAIRIVAAAGSYALTGVAAALKKALRMTMATGSYAVTGQAAALKRALKIIAGTGSYLVTGTALVVAHIVAPANKFKRRVADFVLQKRRTTDPTLED